MIKVIQPGAQDLGDIMVEQIKVSSRGLLGSDRTRFIKRAGERAAFDISKILNLPDEPLIHLLAMGTTERFGPNRNGDGFKEACCIRYHHTFMKYARFYRDHINKDPALSYGVMKLSLFNDPMSRIELVVGLNGSAEAAKRNGGLIADREMEKLAAGKPIPTSMACHIPFDVCSWCGNKAISPKHYCLGIDEGGHCKAGGLRHNIGELVDIDGVIHHLHADNPDPRFFDDSHVFRPADRIAYVLGRLEKVAGLEKMSGAAIADAMQVTAPISSWISELQPAFVTTLVKTAEALATAERGINAESPGLALAFRYAGAPVAWPEDFQKNANQYLRAMSDARVVLPLHAFLEAFLGLGNEKSAGVAESVSHYLPGVYARLTDDHRLPELLAECPYLPANTTLQAHRKFASSLNRWSTEAVSVKRRIWREAIMGSARPAVRVKVAADGSAAQQIADSYAMYQLAFLSSISGTPEETQLTAHALVAHNSTN